MKAGIITMICLAAALGAGAWLVVSMRNQPVTVSFDVKNTGSRAGAEVAQVYVEFPASTGEPPKRLVGWQKVFLQPAQQQLVTVQVNQNDSSHPLSWWNPASSSWQVAPGDYAVYVGNSSSKTSLQLAGTLHIGST